MSNDSHGNLASDLDFILRIEDRERREKTEAGKLGSWLSLL
jgi:hypothetical protein